MPDGAPQIGQLPARIADRISVDEGGCWLWTGRTNHGGYGEVFFDGKTRKSHRVVYAFFRGPIPHGLYIDHLCRVRACCNPEHLEAVTHRENVMRSPVALAAINALKTHCKYGHDFAENAYRAADGQRVCRICLGARNRARYRHEGRVA